MKTKVTLPKFKVTVSRVEFIFLTKIRISLLKDDVFSIYSLIFENISTLK